MTSRTIAKTTTRSFKIVVGLREGYGANATLHSAEEAKGIIKSWVLERSIRGESFLSGALTSGEIIYIKDGEELHEEPMLYFQGDVDPLADNKFKDDEVRDLLDQVADLLAAGLNQTHIFISYKDLTWVRERV